LSAELSTKIIRFLASITISKTGLDEQGLSVVKKITKLLKIDPDKENEIMMSTKAMSIWFK
jgi:hypothetical protein